MKKKIFAGALLLFGTFALANVENVKLDPPEIYCIEVEGPCGIVGTFCEFEGTPINTEEVADFGEWMCED
ncbi:hypothetical protein ACF3NR_09005 [Vaginella massiliensis]|uniref:hypothetical protein n=1 Tax=Vaginella massiliensis TaxID=1816680 RepID=UPI00374FEDF8